MEISRPILGGELLDFEGSGLLKIVREFLVEKCAEVAKKAEMSVFSKFEFLLLKARHRWWYLGFRC